MGELSCRKKWKNRFTQFGKLHKNLLKSKTLVFEAYNEVKHHGKGHFNIHGGTKKDMESVQGVSNATAVDQG